MVEWKMCKHDITSISPGGHVIPISWVKKRKRFEAIPQYGGASKPFPTRRAAHDWLKQIANK